MMVTAITLFINKKPPTCGKHALHRVNNAKIPQDGMQARTLPHWWRAVPLQAAGTLVWLGRALRSCNLPHCHCHPPMLKIRSRHLQQLKQKAEQLFVQSFLHKHLFQKQTMREESLWSCLCYYEYNSNNESVGFTGKHSSDMNYFLLFFVIFPFSIWWNRDVLLSVRKKTELLFFFFFTESRRNAK